MRGRTLLAAFLQTFLQNNRVKTVKIDGINCFSKGKTKNLQLEKLRLILAKLSLLTLVIIFDFRLGLVADRTHDIWLNTVSIRISHIFSDAAKPFLNTIRLYEQNRRFMNGRLIQIARRQISRRLRKSAGNRNIFLLMSKLANV